MSHIFDFFTHQDWHLKEFEVCDTRTNLSFLFKCNQWISREVAEQKGSNDNIVYRLLSFCMKTIQNHAGCHITFDM